MGALSRATAEIEVRSSVVPIHLKIQLEPGAVIEHHRKAAILQPGEQGFNGCSGVILHMLHVAADPLLTVPGHQRLQQVHPETVGRHLRLKIRQ